MEFNAVKQASREDALENIMYEKPLKKSIEKVFLALIWMERNGPGEGGITRADRTMRREWAGRICLERTGQEGRMNGG